jgi:hypothetical protein
VTALVAALAITLGLAFATPARAEIFKCVSKERRVTFQDSPCIGATGSAVEIRPINSGVVVMQPLAPPAQKSSTNAEGGAGAAANAAAGSGANASASGGPNQAASTERATQAQRDAATLKAMEADRKRRTIEYDLGEAETALEALKTSMDQDLAGLRTRKVALTNSVPGSVLETSAASDLLIASERYQVQIRATQDRIAELRKAREDLNAAASATPSTTSATAGTAPKADVRAGAGTQKQ